MQHMAKKDPDPKLTMDPPLLTPFPPISQVAHELLTPLNAILGFAEVLQDGCAGQVTEEQQDLLRHIQESGHQLHDRVRDLLGKLDHRNF